MPSPFYLYSKAHTHIFFHSIYKYQFNLFLHSHAKLAILGTPLNPSLIDYHSFNMVMAKLQLPAITSSTFSSSDQSSSTMVVGAAGTTASFLQDWPEPVIRVQSLSESGSPVIPNRYIKPIPERPTSQNIETCLSDIPLIDLAGLFDNNTLSESVVDQICMACKEWGFFQVVNHGVNPELLRKARKSWKEFFHLPIEDKQVYANSPKTYEGYGSRLGIEKGAILDWNDYFFLHYLPCSLKDPKKWPSFPTSFRGMIDEYGNEVMKLSKIILKAVSISLGLREDYLQNAFGGDQDDDNIGACMRVNYYPKCPQPELALGLSSHSDPGGLTLLLPDDHVAGLQVRKNGNWVTIKPVPDAFIVNIGDQIEVLSNGIYKSIEHRVMVNSVEERVSLAFFYNPRNDLLIEPAKELVTPERPAMYQPMTFEEYRLYIRTKGPKGKSQVESLKSPR